MPNNQQKEQERILYGFWISPYMAQVAQLLKESSIDFRYVRVSPYAGGTISDEHRSRNPLAKIPSFEDSNGFLVSESQAICRYIARTYPEARTFYPCDDPVKCATVDATNDFITFSIGGPFFNFFVIGGYFPQAFRAKTEKESLIFSKWSAFMIKGALFRLKQSSKMEPFLFSSSPCLPDFQLFHILELGQTFSKVFDIPMLNLMKGDKTLEGFYAAMAARTATMEILEAQANELALTERELFEEFGKAYEGMMSEGKVALQAMFGHEV